MYGGTDLIAVNHVDVESLYQACWMSSRVSYAGIQKKGRAPRAIAARGNETMSSGSEDRSRDRRRATSQEERGVRGSAPRRLITFVDSQDPNSRSTIQRHTAHHSNAQRRDARLRSLRNTNRPRILRWSRRQSAEVLPVTSPTRSNSSSSISPLPPLQRPRPPGEEIMNPLVITPISRPTEVRGRMSPEKETAIQYLVEHLCQYSPNRSACNNIITFARTDEACTNLLLAYSISLRLHNGQSTNITTDNEIVRNHLHQGTSLLRARLSDSINATADVNIQAVLLLIAYTADFSSFDEVRIHANALRTMMDQRGGVADENYPPVLALQLRSISQSRFHHLTLDCVEPCEALIRFPRGLFGV